MGCLHGKSERASKTEEAWSQVHPDATRGKRKDRFRVDTRTQSSDVVSKKSVKKTRKKKKKKKSSDVVSIGTSELLKRRASKKGAAAADDAAPSTPNDNTNEFTANDDPSNNQSGPNNFVDGSKKTGDNSTRSRSSVDVKTGYAPSDDSSGKQTQEVREDRAGAAVDSQVKSDANCLTNTGAKTNKNNDGNDNTNNSNGNSDACNTNPTQNHTADDNHTNNNFNDDATLTGNTPSCGGIDCIDDPSTNADSKAPPSHHTRASSRQPALQKLDPESQPHSEASPRQHDAESKKMLKDTDTRASIVSNTSSGRKLHRRGTSSTLDADRKAAARLRQKGAYEPLSSRKVLRITQWVLEQPRHLFQDFAMWKTEIDTNATEGLAKVLASFRTTRSALCIG
ncbi:hypothetical protein DIPPA_02643 [Diplonema papillatum]|nr:hypothetical protein DIPPA_02643 [Diplonema papillatum]